MFIEYFSRLHAYKIIQSRSTYIPIMCYTAIPYSRVANTEAVKISYVNIHELGSTVNLGRFTKVASLKTGHWHI